MVGGIVGRIVLPVSICFVILYYLHFNTNAIQSPTHNKIQSRGPKVIARSEKLCTIHALRNRGNEYTRKFASVLFRICAERICCVVESDAAAARCHQGLRGIAMRLAHVNKCMHVQEINQALLE